MFKKNPHFQLSRFSLASLEVLKLSCIDREVPVEQVDENKNQGGSGSVILNQLEHPVDHL